MTGKTTGPRELDMDYPQFSEPEELAINREMLVAPGDDPSVELIKGPNVKSLPSFEPVDENFWSGVAQSRRRCIHR